MRNKDIHVLGYYKATPKNPGKTRFPGYMKDPNNISWTESINITRGLKPRDLTEAQVILNLNTKSVVRNSWNQGQDFETLLGYYQQNYPNYINPIIARLYKEELDGTAEHVQPKEEKEGSGSQCTTETITAGPREGDEKLA